MKHFITPWGETKYEWPVHIKGKRGKNPALKDLPVEIKGSGIARIGIVLDANSDPAATWEQIRHFVKSAERCARTHVQNQGTLHVLDLRNSGRGLCPTMNWRGWLSTFAIFWCLPMPKPFGNMLASAQSAQKEMGAKFNDTYFPKAHIHTWLAWQSVPGERMGSAITSKRFTTHQMRQKRLSDGSLSCLIFR